MTTSKALAVAPALPIGCVDFNKFHELVADGDVDAAEKATIVPHGERAENQLDITAQPLSEAAPAKPVKRRSPSKAKKSRTARPTITAKPNAVTNPPAEQA